jgi:hypothetical protein
VRAAAFGAVPGAAVRVRAGMDPADRWQVAVALGGTGHYAAAATVLTGLLGSPGVRPVVAAHAAVTLASHRRQLGGHGAARRYDALGLRLADVAPAAVPDDMGTDPLAARIDALVGLAADAIGAGAADTADRLLRAAADTGRRHPSWRPAVRLGWVRAELALLRGDPAAALGPAGHALDLAGQGGSLRHLLKSRIVHAVVRSAAGGDPDEALAALDAAAGEAERTGLLPLVWPAMLAAADVLERAPEQPCRRTVETNDRGSRMAQRSVNDRSRDAPRRRHAAFATVSVILARCDPIGRHLMREGRGLDARLPVM